MYLWKKKVFSNVNKIYTKDITMYGDCAHHLPSKKKKRKLKQTDIFIKEKPKAKPKKNKPKAKKKHAS